MATVSRSQLLFEIFDLIGSTITFGALYGISFTLYSLSVRSLWLQLQEPDKRRNARFNLAYNSLIMIFMTIILVLAARIFHLAYIDHANDSTGGPIDYESLANSAVNAYQKVAVTIDAIVEVLVLTVQIWRLWVVWSGTQYAAVVTALPLLLLLAVIGLELISNVFSSYFPSGTEVRGLTLDTYVKTGAAFYAVISTASILVTVLIILRILLVRRHHVRILGTSDATSPYVGIVAMLIESYALDSIWSISGAISRGLADPSDLLFANTDSSVRVVVYFLVVYRVAAGRGWTKDTERGLTSLRWNRDERATTDEFGNGQSRNMMEIDSEPTSHSKSVV